MERCHLNGPRSIQSVRTYVMVKRTIVSAEGMNLRAVWQNSSENSW